jgi:predicted phosphodiesterase
VSIKIAILSDVHANLEALSAVLEDIDASGVNRIFCLGDIVGYGASANACVKILRNRADITVLGNHDAMVVGEDSCEHLAEDVAAGIMHARATLAPEERHFIADCPMVWREQGIAFVHATLARPHEWHYLNSSINIRDHFDHQIDPVCFCGHTHAAAVWQRNTDGKISSRKLETSVKLDLGNQVVVNVGSVGQPRDGLSSASYVLYEPDNCRVEFRRVKYNYNKSQRQIAKAGLPRFSGQRLALGR